MKHQLYLENKLKNLAKKETTGELALEINEMALNGTRRDVLCLDGIAVEGVLM